MSKRWILALCTFIISSISLQISACDVCGCAVSGHQFGILPQFQKHFVGLRYSYRNFKSVHPPLFSTDVEKVSREYFHTTDLWGRFVLGKRIQLFGFIPYQSITKNENEISIAQRGLGDITVMAMLAIINQKRSEDGKWTQHLQLGGGIKLPTGASNFLDAENEWIPGIQLGTGTTDFMLNANYLVRQNNIGLSAEYSWRVNGHNDKQDFRYGQRQTASIRGFYILDIGNTSLMPYLGATMEHSSLDYHQGAEVDLSGGNVVYGQIGLDFFSNQFSSGISIQPVITQNVANGNLTSGPRISAQFAVLF